MHELSLQLVNWLKDSVEKANAKGAVFGLSGGIDSAVVAALCKRAFGENALGIIMPCYSDPQDEVDARKVATSLELKFKIVYLDRVYDELIKASGDCDNMIAKANVKPRLRMTTLYYHAALYNYLVVGSENKSELFTGYFTKHGDNGVDLMPIGDLVKSEVYSLAKHLKIPEEIMDKKPSAGLWPGQTDEGEMGFGYEQLDEYILTGSTANGEVESKIAKLNKMSEHKRSLPPIFQRNKNMK